MPNKERSEKKSVGEVSEAKSYASRLDSLRPESDNNRVRMRIRDQKGVEAMNGESEAIFRDVFDNTLIGLYRTTPDGRILMANPAVLRMLG